MSARKDGRRPSRRTTAALVVLAAFTAALLALVVQRTAARSTPVPPEALPLAQTAPAEASAVAVTTPALLPLPAIREGDSTPRVVHSRLHSPALKREMPYKAYLPRGYDSGEERYPVLYMLHGYGGGYGEWEYYGLFDAATRAIEAGVLPPLIIVTPEGDLGYWIDHAHNGPRYGTYLGQDVVGYVEREYRTRAARGSRAVGGLSMGADGALNLAFHNAGAFSIIGAHSVVLRTKSQAYSFFGDQRYFEAHDPMSIVRDHGDRVRDADFTIWLDSGETDPWLSHARAFQALLSAKGIPHQWRLYGGDHEGSYWQQHLPDYLAFYGEAFRARNPG